MSLLERMEFDEKTGQLFIDGKIIQTKAIIRFSIIERLAAVTIGLATIATPSILYLANFDRVNHSVVSILGSESENAQSTKDPDVALPR